MLIKAGAHALQFWETEYFQEMSSHQEIFDWIKSTGLRRVLSAINAVTQAEFVKAYIDSIAKEISAPNG